MQATLAVLLFLLFPLVYAQWGCRNQANTAVVDWWWIQKLPNSATHTGYVYLDSTMGANAGVYVHHTAGVLGTGADALMNTIRQVQYPGPVNPTAVAFAGTTITITTPAANHRLLLNSAIYVTGGPPAMQGAYLVNGGAGLTPTTFQYTVPGPLAGPAPAPGAIVVTRAIQIVGWAAAGGGSRVVTTLLPHGLRLGDRITIRGGLDWPAGAAGPVVSALTAATVFRISAASVAAGPPAAAAFVLGAATTVFYGDFVWPDTETANVFHYQDEGEPWAHARGTVASRFDVCNLGAPVPCGFWLTHSVPDFPSVAVATLQLGYPPGGHVRGQHFLCVSIDSSAPRIAPPMPGPLAATGYWHVNRGGGPGIADSVGNDFHATQFIPAASGNARLYYGILEHLRIRGAAPYTTGAGGVLPGNLNNFRDTPFGNWIVRAFQHGGAGTYAGALGFPLLYELNFITTTTGGALSQLYAYAKSHRPGAAFVDAYQYLTHLIAQPALSFTYRGGFDNNVGACCPLGPSPWGGPCAGCSAGVACAQPLRGISALKLRDAAVATALPGKAMDGYAWEDKKDHSKFLVADNDVVCSGDLNRQGGAKGKPLNGNNRRGGGFVCVTSNPLATLLRDMVYERHICSGFAKEAVLPKAALRRLDDPVLQATILLATASEERTVYTGADGVPMLRMGSGPMPFVDLALQLQSQSKSQSQSQSQSHAAPAAPAAAATPAPALAPATEAEAEAAPAEQAAAAAAALVDVHLNLELDADRRHKRGHHHSHSHSRLHHRLHHASAQRFAGAREKETTATRLSKGKEPEWMEGTGQEVVEKEIPDEPEPRADEVRTAEQIYEDSDGLEGTPPGDEKCDFDAAEAENAAEMAAFLAAERAAAQQ